jgi:RNA polymerase sigma-70 factor (ECF subfamily)
MSSADLSTMDAYQELRPLMFAIAYRMLGQVSEAEDIVQEASLRYYRILPNGPGRDSGTGPASGAGADTGAEPQSPRAYLAAITTRLCIDYCRSARARREAYVGQWLPEPLLTGPSAGLAPPLPAPVPAPDPADAAEQADSLSMAFLLVLERLSPVERAVFLLHDVFSYGYDETARIVGRTQDNCRQLARRARQHVSEHRTRYEASRGQREELARRFFAAIGDGDMDGLISMLAADVTVYGDGGGMRYSWRRPIVGRDRVGRLLAGLRQRGRPTWAVLRPVEVNGQPGALFLDGDGALITVIALDIAEGQVQAVRSVINPDKLRHLGPLADWEALVSQSPGGPPEQSARLAADQRPPAGPR